jgi:hypothetical protein
MSAQQSHDEALEEFETYVQNSAAAKESGPFALSLNGFRFDLRIALAAMVLLFLTFVGMSRMDASHYQSILAGHRYSVGTSPDYRWRYDGLDNRMYDPKRKLTLNDWVRLRETGLHVTYDDYLTHRTIRKYKMGSGILLVISVLVTGVAGWHRLQGEPLDEPSGDQDTDIPVVVTRPSSRRPVFGRRAG